MYRPASFFRGFVFPFLENPKTSARQAEIIASILSRQSFPNTHGAAAIFQCCGVPHSGVQNILLKALIEKKFSTPQVVIDRVTEWFLSFDRPEVQSPMPLIWYQTLASFVRIYGG